MNLITRYLIIMLICTLVYANGYSREECKRVFMEEHTTWTFPGRELKALISIPPGTGPFPVVMAIHGGAFNGGNCHRFDSSMHQYFLDKEIAFISVEYRLLRDGGKHPVAIRDCLHNIFWIKDHALDFHIDPERLTVGRDNNESFPVAWRRRRYRLVTGRVSPYNAEKIKKDGLTYRTSSQGGDRSPGIV